MALHPDIRGLGITGSHRSGKTTKAKEIAGSQITVASQTWVEPEYVDMGTTAIVQELGLCVDRPMAPKDRIALQEGLLQSYERRLAYRPRHFVTDRTFLDLAAYPMMDITIGHPGFDADWLAGYVEMCRALQSRFFAQVIIMDTYYPVPDPSKAVGYLNADYARVYTVIVKGLQQEWNRGKTASSD